MGGTKKRGNHVNLANIVGKCGERNAKNKKKKREKQNDQHGGNQGEGPVKKINTDQAKIQTVTKEQAQRGDDPGINDGEKGPKSPVTRKR